ncbi:MAG: N-acetyltransferase, partial [Proteobacteria bacterium]
MGKHIMDAANRMPDSKTQNTDENGYVLRPIELSDCHFLFDLRNEKTARINSLDTRPLVFEDHERWLQRSIEMKSRSIFVFEVENKKAGMARADKLPISPIVYECSWNVATDFRGQGLSVPMLMMLIKRLQSDVVARIKDENSISQSVAQKAGFSYITSQDGVGLWMRASQTLTSEN